jgi:hypothetical protein
MIPEPFTLTSYLQSLPKPTKQYSKYRDEIKLDEVGGMYSMHREMRDAHKILLSKDLKRRDCIGDLDVDVRIILKWILMN